MFNKLYKQCPNPGHTISVARAKARLQEEYLCWKDGLPDQHIERFVEEGLRPLLKRHGYYSSLIPQNLAKACEEWAFAHVQIRRKGPDLYDRFFMKCVHYGGEEEFDWYTHRIPFETWDAFRKQWTAPEFLDDSDAGYAQTIDLAQFAWQTIHLDSSPSHIRWKAIIEQAEHDDEYTPALQTQPCEDAGAYGGDRRTL